MQRTISSTLFAIALSGAFLASPVFAQRYHAFPAFDADTLYSYLDKEMDREFGQVVLRFWEPRLNAYKLKIDEIFSSRDLTALNELRVSFAILIERVHQMENKQKEEREEYARQYEESKMAASEAEIAIDTALVSYSEEELAEMEMVEAEAAEYDEVESEDLSSEEVERRLQEQQREYEEQERIYEEQRRLKAEAEMDAVEAALERGETATNEFGEMSLYNELQRLPAIVGWMARDYRSQLDVMVDNARLDLLKFADTLDVYRQGFLTRHGAEVARLKEYERERLSRNLDGYIIRSMAQRPLTFHKKYVMQMEQFVLLYDGEGLGKLLNMVPGTPAGNDIPNSSLIEETAPNPAVATSTVSYVLPEASTATAINLYNASGELLQELNEGARPAGHHEAVINVAKLPSGWYLVRLAVTLPSGDRVSTHAIQVVH